MSKVILSRAFVGLASFAALCAASSLFAQDAQTEASKPALSVGSISPFTRSEVPANQAPNLDRNSNEFNYFREELGRSELSSRAKFRLQQLASRVSYDDPMDKPTVYGEKFINIFDADEVLSDGKTFVGSDDPDVLYEPDENNFLAKFAEACQLGATLVKLMPGAPSSNPNDPMNPMGMNGVAPTDSPMMGPPMMGPMGAMGPGGAPAKVEVKVEPSAKDDSALIFPVKEGETATANPFSGPVALDAAADLDLFKADREFVVKAPQPTNSSMMGMGPMMGVPPVGPPMAGGSGDGPSAPPVAPGP